ncbi:MAG: cupin domain-containing protein [Geminicoccaceae bacterium]
MSSQKFRAALCFPAMLAAAVMLVGGAATAGECPADKVMADAQKPGPSKPKGVTDTVRASIDLAKEAPALDGRDLRLRELVIKPGGIVPWHSHAERPAIIYIVSGTVVEYASTCAVPLVHKAGDVVAETHPVTHWWRNEGKTTVKLLSADIFDARAADKAKAHVM